MKDEQITISKNDAMKKFFTEYAYGIAGELFKMDNEDRIEYLTNDIFISCASAATEIKEQDFVDYSTEFFKKHKI
ncbi:hypothetical protein [Neisseria sp. Ec49-e6-T10]|uniref:hypothetical protein n=1 Tax=Neisseria sp. Ec49-e6-T10 TaxID=3140744 RepID=UPI003EBCED1A